MKTLAIISAGMLAATATPVLADDWRLASYTNQYPAVLVLVDADSISRANGKVIFRSQSFFEQPLSGGTTRTVEMMDTDCTGKSYRTLSGVYYAGAAVIDRKQETSKLYTASPNSMNEGMIFSACGKKEYQSQTIADPVKYASDHFATLDEDDWDY